MCVLTHLCMSVDICSAAQVFAGGTQHCEMNEIIVCSDLEWGRGQVHMMITTAISKHLFCLHCVLVNKQKNLHIVVFNEK